MVFKSFTFKMKTYYFVAYLSAENVRLLMFFSRGEAKTLVKIFPFKVFIN